MALRPFVVVTLPAKDTVFGDLSTDGAHVELVAHPEWDDRFGACWAVAFAVDGPDTLRLREGRQRLAALHAVLASDLIEGGSWRGAGWIPVQNVGSRAFRLLWDPDMDAAPAWVVMEAGVAQVRLRPSTSGGVDGFEAEVRRHMEQRGISSDVRQVPLDAVDYQAHLERLQWLDGDIVTPQSLS